MPADYYDTLGIAKEATEAEIKKAYRKQALKFHPDKNPGDAEAEKRFKDAAEAYDILRDNEKRSRYDRFGHDGVNAMGGMGGSSNFTNVEDIFSAFGDMFSGGGGGGGGGIFEGLFGGGGRQRSGPRRGESLRAQIELTFEQAAEGCKKTLDIKRLINCEGCSGSGAKSGTQPKTCDTCRGMGQVQQTQGFFSVRTACPHCQGAGQVIADPCPACKGQGRTDRRQDLELDIPAGIDHGTTLRVTNQGHFGKGGGPPGDLMVTVVLKQHEFFERHEDDVVCEVPISYAQAALGATIEVPSLSGKVDVKVPAGSQPGDILRLRDQGFPSLQGYGKGDQLIQLTVEVPKSLTAEQEELLRKLAEIDAKQVDSKRHSFFEKLKNYFD